MWYQAFARCWGWAGCFDMLIMVPSFSFHAQKFLLPQNASLSHQGAGGRVTMLTQRNSVSFLNPQTQKNPSTLGEGKMR